MSLFAIKLESARLRSITTGFLDLGPTPIQEFMRGSVRSDSRTWRGHTKAHAPQSERVNMRCIPDGFV